MESRIARSFEARIDDVVEFEETWLPSAVREMTIADVLYKLEAIKDIPVVKLVAFNGIPLHYVEFYKQFKTHIHDKPHLTDDTCHRRCCMHDIWPRITRNHVCHCPQPLKEHFGQPSVVARAFISKMTERRKIQSNDQQALCEFSLTWLIALQRSGRLITSLT